jgi:hypothetical protein
MPARVSGCLTIRLTAIYITPSTRCATAERSVHAVHRCIVLAIRRTLSHNRDEFENGMWRRRARKAQALSDSEAGGAQRAAIG